MVHAISDQLARFTRAARAIMEGYLVDASAGRYSTTVFVTTDGRYPLAVTAALQAARNGGLGVVVLQFGFGSKAKEPHGYTVAAMVEGEQQVVADCAL